jgi:hypothetical protein
MKGHRFPRALPLGRVSVLLAAALLSGCNLVPVGDSPAPFVQTVPFTGAFDYTVHPGSSPRSVYFVFTNPSTTADLGSLPVVSHGQLLSIDGHPVCAPAPQPLHAVDRHPSTMDRRVAEFNRTSQSQVSGFTGSAGPAAGMISALPASSDTVGATAAFVTDIDGLGNPSATVGATCRLATGPVAFADGRTRALSIWVDSANWDPTDTSATMMTPSKILALADRFLRSPEQPGDIYHWDTAVVGEPWGIHTDAQLIPWDNSGTITILLANLNAVYSGPVYVGYYWAKDNYSTAYCAGSNQRIMFYIDATLYGTLEGAEATWSEGNYWPRLVRSTLGHEFQHMIHFYQKQVLFHAPTNTDTWINEMCSMIMEDLVADKLDVEGPRGVSAVDGTAGAAHNTAGRIPYFNLCSYYGLVQPASYSLYDYSVSYAFGAWLARNFGGAALLRMIVRCPQTDETAVVDAARAFGSRGETLGDLLREWSSAVLLSDATNAPAGYRYNTGGWSSFSCGGVGYRLGSINFFNYDPPLFVLYSISGLPGSQVAHSSNLYFQAAGGLTGSRTWSLEVPTGIDLDIVVK